MMIKRILACAAAALLCLANAPVCMAAAPCVHITVKYDTDITPQEGDEFSVTYRVAGQLEEAVITFDASVLASKSGRLDMDAAAYEITGVTYTGSDGDITDYAISPNFVVSEDSDDAQVVLGIGEGEASKVLAAYPDAIAVSDGENVTSFADGDTETTEGAEDTEDTGDGDTGTEDAQDSDTEDAQEPVVVHETDGDGEPESSGNRAVPLVIFGLIGAGAIAIVAKLKLLD